MEVILEMSVKQADLLITPRTLYNFLILYFPINATQRT